MISRLRAIIDRSKETGNDERFVIPRKADGEGFEQVAFSSGKTHISEATNAPSDARVAANHPVAGESEVILDPDLSAIMDAWPSLSTAERAAILEIVRHGAGE